MWHALYHRSFCPFAHRLLLKPVKRPALVVQNTEYIFIPPKGGLARRMLLGLAADIHGAFNWTCSVGSSVFARLQNSPFQRFKCWRIRTLTHYRDAQMWNRTRHSDQSLSIAPAQRSMCGTLIVRNTGLRSCWDSTDSSLRYHFRRAFIIPMQFAQCTTARTYVPARQLWIVSSLLTSSTNWAITSNFGRCLIYTDWWFLTMF